MAQTQSGAKVKLTPFAWWWLGVLGLLLIAALVAGYFDDATELTPDHSDNLSLCFGVAAILGVVSMLVVFFQSHGPRLKRAIGVMGVGLYAAVSGAMLGINLSQVIEMKLDFPPAQTQTFTGNLLISRAYRSSSKKADCDIQTEPLWSDLNITTSDYEFMLSHRRPGDSAADPDEISSRGYFCAKVTLQRAGNAVRVLHAGNGKLPAGTVGICPQGVVSAIRLTKPDGG